MASIVAFAGAAGVGKRTAARVLCDEYRFRVCEGVDSITTASTEEGRTVIISCEREELAAVVRKAGGRVVHLERAGTTVNQGPVRHEDDLVIANDGSLDAFILKVRQIIDVWPTMQLDVLIHVAGANNITDMPRFLSDITHVCKTTDVSTYAFDALVMCDTPLEVIREVQPYINLYCRFPIYHGCKCYSTYDCIMLLGDMMVRLNQSYDTIPERRVRDIAAILGVPIIMSRKRRHRYLMRHIDYS
jgi:hypothetical protein